MSKEERDVITATRNLVLSESNAATTEQARHDETTSTKEIVTGSSDSQQIVETVKIPSNESTMQGEQNVSEETCRNIVGMEEQASGEVKSSVGEQIRTSGTSKETEGQGSDGAVGGSAGEGTENREGEPESGNSETSDSNGNGNGNDRSQGNSEGYSTDVSNQTSVDVNLIEGALEVNIPKKNYVFRVVVLGEQGVGKTSIVRRYLQGTFSHDEIDYHESQLRRLVTKDYEISVEVIDVPSEHREPEVNRLIFKGVTGAFIVADGTSSEFLQRALEWKRFLNSQVLLPGGYFVPCILLVNKCDLLDSDVEARTNEISTFSTHYILLEWFYTSALNNINVDTAFKVLIAEMIKNKDLEEQEEALRNQQRRNAVLLDSPPPRVAPCCCQ